MTIQETRKAFFEKTGKKMKGIVLSENDYREVEEVASKVDANSVTDYPFGAITAHSSPFVKDGEPIPY